MTITVTDKDASLTFATKNGDIDTDDVAALAKAMYAALYEFNNPE